MYSFIRAEQRTLFELYHQEALVNVYRSQKYSHPFALTELHLRYDEDVLVLRRRLKHQTEDQEQEKETKLLLRALTRGKEGRRAVYRVHRKRSEIRR